MPCPSRRADRSAVLVPFGAPTSRQKPTGAKLTHKFPFSRALAWEKGKRGGCGALMLAPMGGSPVVEQSARPEAAELQVCSAGTDRSIYCGLPMPGSAAHCRGRRRDPLGGSRGRL